MMTDAYKEGYTYTNWSGSRKSGFGLGRDAVRRGLFISKRCNNMNSYCKRRSLNEMAFSPLMSGFDWPDIYSMAKD
jgi:hypothetical protein